MSPRKKVNSLRKQCIQYFGIFFQDLVGNCSRIVVTQNPEEGRIQIRNQIDHLKDNVFACMPSNLVIEVTSEVYSNSEIDRTVLT